MVGLLSAIYICKFYLSILFICFVKLSGIETVVNRPTWIPSKNHPFTANIDAAVQSYRANLRKKLAGTGLVVVDQAYYPLCYVTSWSSIDRKGDVDNLEFGVGCEGYVPMGKVGYK